MYTFNHPFGDQTQLKIKLETEAKLFIQQGMVNGSYELVWTHHRLVICKKSLEDN